MITLLSLLINKKQQNYTHRKMLCNVYKSYRYSLCTCLNHLVLSSQLRKVELLGVSSILFITIQRGQHRLTKIVLKNIHIHMHPSAQIMQSLYEAVVQDINDQSPFQGKSVHSSSIFALPRAAPTRTSPINE